MKVKNIKLTTFLIALITVTLACGSESGIEVNPPSADQPEVVIAEPSATSGVGTVRSNPAPVGSEVLADDMAFVVTGSTRPATDIIMAGNPFNTEPEPNQEYILVNIQITCKKSTDEKCDMFSSSFSVLGSTGISRDPEIIVAGVDGLLDFNIDFYGGAVVAGSIPFIVEIGETDLLLVYEPFWGDNFFLALE